jgi:hypothetical protein
MTTLNRDIALSNLAKGCETMNELNHKIDPLAVQVTAEAAKAQAMLTAALVSAVLDLADAIREGTGS